jgi:hypothetical protein
MMAFTGLYAYDEPLDASGSFIFTLQCFLVVHTLCP